MTTVDPAFVAAHTSEATMNDGTRILLRPVIPEDREELMRAVERMSPESRYRRFMGPIQRLTDEQGRYLTEIDYRDHFAWVAMLADDPTLPGIGVSRYVRDPDQRDVAEAAVAVLDAYQGRGIGTLLLEALVIEAVDNGIKRFRGAALAGNAIIRDLLEHNGAVIGPASGGEIEFALDLPTAMGELAKTPMYAALREAARAPHPPFKNPHAPPSD